MPRRSMRDILWARRDQEDAMAEVRRASEARQEAYARAKLTPVPPLEGKAAPIDPPQPRRSKAA